ncbi:YbaB/EbfC family nucleoid-associated protein [Vicingaceae bacterium]|nr:YbaB/EbfC family nucleoid-associated protein [Vicingaceae bacterium]
MFGDMMGKLQEMKQQTEKIKKRLDSISVDGDAEGGMVKVVVTANKKVTSITISNELMAEGDKEQIEDLTMIALNKALAKAEDVSDAEMAGAAKGFLPGMGL